MVNLSTGAAAGGHAAGDSFKGIENVIGSPHADVLTGNFETMRLEAATVTTR
jgi:hypothetical protein